MRQEIVLVVVGLFVFGYSVILGNDATGPIDYTTTVVASWNENSTTNATEDSNITNATDYPSTVGFTRRETTNDSNLPLGPFTTPHAKVPLDQGDNGTTDNYTTTSEGPPVNVTGSPATSSSLNTDQGAQKRIDEGQRFDTASFVGGIILAVGVLSLGFFLFKVYQSRKGPRAEYNNI